MKNKTLMKIWGGAILFFLLGNTSCEPMKPAASAASGDNPELVVEYLGATADGCKIYRFHDDGRNHYFVRCPEGVNALGTFREGKVDREEKIPTVPIRCVPAAWNGWKCPAPTKAQEEELPNLPPCRRESLGFRSRAGWVCTERGWERAK